MKQSSDPYGTHWALFKVLEERLLADLKKSISVDFIKEWIGIRQSDGSPKPVEPSMNERYWINWFREFVEIQASVQRLEQALVYLSHYPASRVFRFHGLSEADWLRYHIEAYIQETYILCERVKRFLRKVEKATIAANDKDGLRSVRMLKTVVDDTFKKVLRTRGSHVHEYRFDDDGLKQLDGLVILTKMGKLRVLRPIREFRYTTTLNKLRKQVRTNNKETHKFCTALFEETTSILTRNEPLRSSF